MALEFRLERDPKSTVRTVVVVHVASGARFEAELPPVITVDISLICRDTEPLREFVSAFDSSMGVSGSGQVPHGDLRHMVDYAW